MYKFLVASALLSACVWLGACSASRPPLVYVEPSYTWTDDAGPTQGTVADAMPSEEELAGR